MGNCTVPLQHFRMCATTSKKLKTEAEDSCGEKTRDTRFRYPNRPRINHYYLQFPITLFPREKEISALKCKWYGEYYRCFNSFECWFNGLELTFSVFVYVFFLKIFLYVKSHPGFGFVCQWSKSVVLCRYIFRFSQPRNIFVVMSRPVIRSDCKSNKLLL